MTTKFLDNKIAISKFYCRGVSHEKQRIWPILSLPPKAPPLNTANFIFIVVSLSFWK